MPLLANIQIYVPYLALILESGVRKMTMKRTISGMIGTGSLAHNRRDFIAENVDPDRVQLNICYRNENLKEVYKELFDEATPHLHIDFIPYVTGWKGKGMDTRVSLKQALKSLGFQGGNKHDTEMNQWIKHEKEVLAEIAKQHGIE